MLIWLNWASMVGVVSEPVWPTWTSLLEALAIRTAPFSVSNGLIKMFAFSPTPPPKLSAVWKRSEGYRKMFILRCGNLLILPRSCFVVPLCSSHHLSTVLSWVCCAWHSFTAHLDALMCTNQAVAWFCGASQSSAGWPYRWAGQLDFCQLVLSDVGVC